MSLQTLLQQYSVMYIWLYYCIIYIQIVYFIMYECIFIDKTNYMFHCTVFNLNFFFYYFITFLVQNKWYVLTLIHLYEWFADHSNHLKKCFKNKKIVVFTVVLLIIKFNWMAFVERRDINEQLNCFLCCNYI